MKSGFLKLGWRDALRGIIMAGIGSVIAIIYPSIEAGNWIIDWTNVWHGAVLAMIAYLIKNLFTDDTAAAIKTIEKAGGQVQDTTGKVITKQKDNIDAGE